MQKAGWLDYHSYDESIGLLKEFALAHASLAGRFQVSLSRIISESAWDQLLGFELDYRDSDDPLSLYHARQALSFFQKFEPLRWTGSKDKEKAAFRSFVQSEGTCSRVNQRFCNYRLGTPMGYPYDVILTDAREKIRKVLDAAPALEQLEFTFGPGSTVSTKKKEACFRVKLGAPPECSSELMQFVDRFLSQLPLYTLLHADEVGLDFADVYVARVFGRLQFVPKDAKKFRTIIVEPGLNVLFQQGLGKAIRKRLKKAGIDLSTQERNRALAKLGSENNSIATVDFSSASDNIASQLVAFLLPDDWLTLLSLARTGQVEYEGIIHKLEKFSTMGNSFTFELESLIFWALAWACLRHLGLSQRLLSIFGDDLIIPSDAYSLCELVFAFCGFTINDRKSFRSGPFRESCGGDFFKGLDIRPYYQKTLVSPETLFSLHNYYMRSGELDFAKVVRSKLHPDLIIFGPDGYGDGHLIGDWTPLRKKVKITAVDAKGRRKVERVFPSELGWSGGFFYSYRHVQARDERRHAGDELLPAYSIYARGEGDNQKQPHSPQGQCDWADPKYFVVPGSVGYEKVPIYTQRLGIFL